MSESERVQRLKEHRCYHDSSDGDLYKEDETLANRIMLLLNDPKVDKYCMVDAYYYDFSVIPREVQQRLQIWRDCYFIYGVNVDGEIVSKWVDRWDLDSDHPIVNGTVEQRTFDEKALSAPDINIKFNNNLLSTPMPDILQIFKTQK